MPRRRGKRKKALRDRLIRGEKSQIGFDTYEIDSPSIYDTITLDSTYTVDHPESVRKTKKRTQTILKEESFAVPSEGPTLDSSDKGLTLDSPDKGLTLDLRVSGDLV
jgi:hypothetical protein